jgi:hypothetical protein
MMTVSTNTYIGIAVIIIALVLLVLWYRRRTQSKYTYDQIKTGGSPPESTTYSNIVACQLTFNTSNVTATDATRPALLNTFNQCVRSNVGFYVDTKCVWVTTDTNGIMIAPTTVGVNGATASDVAAYTQFTNDQNAIQTAYVDLFTRSSDTTSPTTEMVDAAFKADLTGATRRYLSTVCSNYFKTATNDPSTIYSEWRVATGATAPTVYSFWPGATGKVTAAMVTTWVAKAARYTSATDAQLQAGSEPYTVGSPYLASGSTYNQNSTIANPSASGTFYQNWEVSRDNGPGTINSQV